MTKEQIIESNYEAILLEFAKTGENTITFNGEEIEFCDDLLEQYEAGEVANDYKEMLGNVLMQLENILDKINKL